jgi:hypothetical protein
MRLRTLQNHFQAYVLHGAAQIRERVVSGPSDNAARRLRIYYDAYRLRLIEALAGDYATLRAVLGEGAFHAAAAAYVHATASRLRNVRWYGAQLPDFLRDTAPWNARRELADIARFEWTLTLAFDAAEAPRASLAELAALAPESWPAIAFVLHPSAHLLRLSGNAPVLRKAVDAGVPLPAIESGDSSVDWLIWRNGANVCFRSLSVAERRALEATQRGARFAAICERAYAFVPADHAPALVAGWLRAWVDDSLIAAVVQPACATQ